MEFGIHVQDTIPSIKFYSEFDPYTRLFWERGGSRHTIYIAVQSLGPLEDED